MDLLNSLKENKESFLNRKKDVSHIAEEISDIVLEFLHSVECNSIEIEGITFKVKTFEASGFTSSKLYINGNGAVSGNQYYAGNFNGWISQAPYSDVLKVVVNRKAILQEISKMYKEELQIIENNIDSENNLEQK